MTKETDDHCGQFHGCIDDSFCHGPFAVGVAMGYIPSL